MNFHQRISCVCLFNPLSCFSVRGKSLRDLLLSFQDVGQEEEGEGGRQFIHINPILTRDEIKPYYY